MMYLISTNTSKLSELNQIHFSDYPKQASIIKKISNNKSFLIGTLLSGMVSISGCSGGSRIENLSTNSSQADAVGKRITANNIDYKVNIGSNTHTFDWSLLSGAQDLDGKNITAWFKKAGSKGTFVISGKNIVYSPNEGQFGEDNFVISIISVFDNLPGSSKDIEVKVRGIDTLNNVNPVIKGISDNSTYHTKVLPSWQNNAQNIYSAKIDGQEYISGTWIGNGSHVFELKTFDSSSTIIKTSENISFTVDENISFDTFIKDNFNTFNVHTPKPNTDFALVNSGGEALIRLTNLKIPSEKVGMKMKFDNEEMSKNVISSKISFDNKIGGMASITIKLLDGNTISNHEGILRLTAENWSDGSSKEIALTYTVLSK